MADRRHCQRGISDTLVRLTMLFGSDKLCSLFIYPRWPVFSARLRQRRISRGAVVALGVSADWCRYYPVSLNLRRKSPGPVARVTNRPDDRSPIAIAYSWASRITGVSLEMVIPGLLGLWLDSRLGTVCLFTLLGFAGGMSYGLWHLIRMTSPLPDGDKEGRTGERNQS